MENYNHIIQTLRSEELFFKEAADAVEELTKEVKRLTEENKELRSRIDYCTRTAMTPFTVATSDEVKSLGPYGPTNTRGSINVNK